MTQPSEAQKSALMKFGYTSKQVDNMSFETASSTLMDLISKAKERDAAKQITSTKPKANSMLESVIASSATTLEAAVGGSYDMDANLEYAVRKAKRMLAENPQLVDISQGLLAELCREYFDIWMNKKIEGMDIAKMRVYGK